MMKSSGRAAVMFMLGLAVLAINSCDLFKEDMFPAYLGHEEARISLSELRQAAGVPETARLETIRTLEIPALNKGYVVLTFYGFFSPPYQVFLDGKSLAVLKTFTDVGNGRFLMYDANTKGILIRHFNDILVLDPGSLNENEQHQAIFLYFDDPWFGVRKDTNTIFVIGMHSGDVSYLKVNIDGSNNWTGASASQKDIFFTYPSSDAADFYIKDLYIAADSGVYLLLGQKESDRGYLFRWNTAEDFIGDLSEGSAPLVAPTTNNDYKPTYIQVPKGKDGSGYVCRAGYFRTYRDRTSVIERYRYDTAQASLIDSFSLPSNFQGRAAFFQNGDAWVLFDEGKQTLHLMRGWW
ncbi:hypothetical protein [Gracilinema caldarium]|uniref:hypothetical protein n=1 Tax=Gracilinema caldarium TaxID=215591 RepID=UPI0026EE63D7|nr:hypothetical protein [Gracilinema caldarium]